MKDELIDKAGDAIEVATHSVAELAKEGKLLLAEHTPNLSTSRRRSNRWVFVLVIGAIVVLAIAATRRIKQRQSIRLNGELEQMTREAEARQDRTQPVPVSA